MQFCIGIKSSDMKTPFLTLLSSSVEPDLSPAYLIAAIIALLILGYLFFTLIKPEKF